MAYFYDFEWVLAGIILLSTMTAAGIRIWIKRKRELKKTGSLEKKHQEENADFSNT